jgi:hypothetical protein
MATLALYTPPTAEDARREQDAAAKLGLDLNYLNQFTLNPNAFIEQYGQFRDPTTGVFKIEGVTPGALMQNPNYAPGVLNPDGTAIRAGTIPTATSSSGGGFAPLPNYLGGVPQGIPGLNEFFDPNFGRTETMTRANENAVAGGWGSGGFAGGQGLKLLDSERKANILAGHQILEPYLNREFQGSQNEADRQSRLNQIAAEGAQALQRLQLSEAGQGSRLSTELAARLRDQVLQGQQAMQQLTLREAGETGRQREAIGGRLAETVLGAALSPRATSGRPTAPPTPSGPLGPTYGVPSNQNLFNAPMAYNPAARGWSSAGSSSVTSLLGGSSIDQLLRKYGLL